MDPAAQPFQQGLRFTPPRPFMTGWWNGLIYSEHQLAIVPRLPDYLSKRRYSRRDKTFYPRLPEPDPFLLHWATWYHRIALMATALEVRYLPVLDPDYIYLVNAEPSGYQAYREAFDPVAMSETLRYPPEQVRKDAEELLLFAHSINPLGGPWDQLLRRALRDSWRDFKGDALSVMSMRETAEILLRFYEDLVERGATLALPPLPARAWHPLTERLSERRQTLDQDLMNAGLSPHYGVVLALEGDTEEMHAPGVAIAAGQGGEPVARPERGQHRIRQPGGQQPRPPVPGEEPHIGQENRVSAAPDLIIPAVLPREPTRPVQRPGHLQVGEPDRRLDVHQLRGLISAHQEEVRHVTAHPPASVRPQQERLGSDRRHRRIEIGNQQPRQLQPALVDHVRASRLRPVKPWVMRLPPGTARRAPGNRRYHLACPHIPKRPAHLTAVSHAQRHHRLRRRLCARAGSHLKTTSHNGPYRRTIPPCPVTRRGDCHPSAPEITGHHGEHDTSLPGLPRHGRQAAN